MRGPLFFLKLSPIMRLSGTRSVFADCVDQGQTVQIMLSDLGFSV